MNLVYVHYKIYQGYCYCCDTAFKEPKLKDEGNAEINLQDIFNSAGWDIKDIIEDGTECYEEDSATIIDEYLGDYEELNLPKRLIDRVDWMPEDMDVLKTNFAEFLKQKVEDGQ